MASSSCIAQYSQLRLSPPPCAETLTTHMHMHMHNMHMRTRTCTSMGQGIAPTLSARRRFCRRAARLGIAGSRSPSTTTRARRLWRCGTSRRGPPTALALTPLLPHHSLLAASRWTSLMALLSSLFYHLHFLTGHSPPATRQLLTTFQAEFFVDLQHAQAAIRAVWAAASERAWSFSSPWG